jgi:hypothetical protein
LFIRLVGFASRRDAIVVEMKKKSCLINILSASFAKKEQGVFPSFFLLSRQAKNLLKDYN